MEIRRGHVDIVDFNPLIGQLIAVANESFRQEIGVLPENLMAELERRVRVILGL